MSARTALNFEHVDVLVVGAGLTGIGVGYHLTTQQPGKTFAIIDGRDAIGGTWDLFRYPGIRSDADLHTFGFGFKPWTRDNAIANGDEILEYLQETIDENDLGPHIHLGHKVIRADFSSEEARWTVTLERTSDGEQFGVSCSMLFSAAGYYDVDKGYTPHFDGRDDFEGQIVHPQHWPADLDYTGKRVVVIGSGATAVTLIPSMTAEAEHVTMLQRSPSYVFPLPRQDPIANTLRRLLPETTAYAITRKFNITRQNVLYNTSKRYPDVMRKFIRKANVGALPEGYDVDTHFNPKYGPWDERMCVVPDADLFKAISSEKASVVTDQIVRFTKTGILLESGTELQADIIVTATGMNLVPFGKIALSVDSEPVNVPDTLVYKGLMISAVPNFVFTMGYNNRPWTLKADLVSVWFCRLLAHMDRHGQATVTPIADDATLTRRPWIEMGGGYVERSRHLHPQQGSHGPWRVVSKYSTDRAMLGKDPIEEPSLRFTGAGELTSPLHPVRSGAPTMITVQSRRTRVRVEGDVANPPVLLLHGIGRSLEDWAPQFPRLAGTHRVISLDLPGFGFSARSPEPVTLELLARAVIETLDALGEQRPLHVVGNSLGGAVAQQLVALAPDRVASLVLVNSAGFGSKAALPLRLMATPVVGPLLSRRTTASSARMAERLMFADPKMATTERIEHALAISQQPDPNVVAGETIRKLATFRGVKPGWRADLIAGVAKNPRPALIVWGDRDRVLPTSHLDAARAAIPNAQAELIVGAGHTPQLERPDEFAARVLAFFADVERPAPSVPSGARKRAVKEKS